MAAEDKSKAWGAFWCLALGFVAWPLSAVVSIVYVLVLPFSACLPKFKPKADRLLHVVQFPYTFTRNMLEGNPCRRKPEVREENVIGEDFGATAYP